MRFRRGEWFWAKNLTNWRARSSWARVIRGGRNTCGFGAGFFERGNFGEFGIIQLGKGKFALKVATVWGKDQQSGHEIN